MMDTRIKMSKAISLKKANDSKSESALRISSEQSLSITCESTLSQVSQIDIGKFCAKKLFYIFIVNESDDESGSLLHDLININKSYEEISGVTFISRDDVLDLSRANKDQIFPNPLKPLLLNVIETTHSSSTDMSLIVESQLLKLKLIQVMYSQYVDKAKTNEKQRTLESLLNILSKECKRKQKKDEDKTKLQVKEDNKKPIRKDNSTLKDSNKDEGIDYTTIPLNNDGISYEKNLFDYVWFYCFNGFYNADIIENLMVQVGIPVSGIIKVDDNKADAKTSDDVQRFWSKIKQCFFENTSPYAYLENTILLHFTVMELKKSLTILEEFVFMLRNILKVKLTHLNYIRNMKIHKIQHSYRVIPLECLHRYNKYFDNLPSECINPQLVLSGLLNQVCFNMNLHSVSDTPSVSSLVFANRYKSFHCLNLLHDVDVIAPRQQSQVRANLININSTVPSFLVHEDNIIIKILKSYKSIEPKIADATLNLMKRIPILSRLNYSNIMFDIKHLHDIDPARTQKARTDVVDDLMYIFLFSKVVRDTCIPAIRPVYVLLDNLCTFDLFQYWNDVQSKFDDRTYFDENIYDTSLIHFYWKENLSKEVLIQEAFAASHEFLYADKKYSPETDNFLVVFSDKLDEFGINIKIINVVVRTPVCIRDFCRYSTTDEAAWLQKNEININGDTFETSLQENCPGVQKIKTELNIFQEYSHLLRGDVNEDNNDLQSCTSQQSFPNQTSEMILSNILSDLETCSPKMKVIEEIKTPTKDQQIIAYDLGSNVFKVIGKLTTFHSHDNVKVTIDNTRFLQSPDKCTFTVTSEGYTLILHTGESLVSQPYIVTVILSDSTRLSLFIQEETNIEETREIDKSIAKPDNQKDENEIGNIIYNKDTFNEPLVVDDISSVDNGATDTNAEQFVHYVDVDFINTLLEGRSLDDLSLNGDTEDLLESLTKAMENNGMIYKVNTPSNYLKRQKSDIKAPLGNALRNIVSVEAVPKKQQKSYMVFTKRFGSNRDNKSYLNVNSPVDFRICLPNGLYIRPHSSVVDQSNIMIKQEYIAEKPNVLLIQHEEFRLFSNQGLVLIKKVDGTISILKANGDMFSFEKPSNGFEETSTINPCHCSTLDDYRNKLNKLLKSSSDYSPSRRGHNASKQSHILDNKILKVLEEFNVPFMKKSITKFDGKKIKIQGDKITQKQLYHLTSQHDFVTGEISFERNDEFRSMFYKNGSQMIMFPDGTIISTSIDASDELVDDFVYVKLSYQYEHPYYVTTRFNFDKTSEITLNDNVVIRESCDKNGFQVDMNHGISLSASSETMNFRKVCASCTGQIDINFNIKPFRDGCWNPYEEFMYIKDSYNKVLRSDFVGNCSRNSDYIKSTLNEKKCNHVKKVLYKKLFIINKDLTGTTFITNDFVKNKINKMKYLPNASVDTYNPISNENKTTIVDCREKFFVRYSERFFNNTNDTLPSCLGKSNNHQTHFYTTFRTFHKMFDSIDEIASHVSNMWHVFFKDFFDISGDLSIYQTITDLGNELEVYFRKYKEDVLMDENDKIVRKDKQIEDLNKKENGKVKCSCLLEKCTVEGNINKWKQECTKYRTQIRKKLIPIYFNSQFCKRTN